MSNGTVSITASSPGMWMIERSGIPWTQDMTVLEAMERAYDDVQPWLYAIEYYGSAGGYLVIGVQWTFDGNAGVWAYKVNGSYASAGVNCVTLNSGDQVDFVYQSFAPEERSDVPIIEAKYQRRAAATNAPGD
jgi:hypothetical protein